jgi:hypothetical protein
MHSSVVWVPKELWKEHQSAWTFFLAWWLAGGEDRLVPVMEEVAEW